jgi:hypothetical protein
LCDWLVSVKNKTAGSRLFAPKKFGQALTAGQPPGRYLAVLLIFPFNKVVAFA